MSRKGLNVRALHSFRHNTTNHIVTNGQKCYNVKITPCALPNADAR